MRVAKVVSFLSLTASCLASICDSHAFAGQAISLSKGPDTGVGNGQAFSVNYDSNAGYLPIGWTWYIKYTYPNGGIQYQQIDGGSDNVNITWYFPGNLTFYCMISYDLVGGAQPPSDLLSIAVTSFPPDTETVASLSNNGICLTGAGNYVVVNTKWSYQGQSIIMDASTTAEEHLVYVSPPLPNQYFDWQSGDQATWSFNIDTLSDSKSAPGPYTGFCGSVIMQLWQQNRLKYMDQQGNWKYAYGPARLWVRRIYCNPNDPNNSYWSIGDETASSGAQPPDVWVQSN